MKVSEYTTLFKLCLWHSIESHSVYEFQNSKDDICSKDFGNHTGKLD